MANTFIQPLFNPIPLFKETPDSLPQHHTKYFDQWPFESTIADWEQYVDYPIPYQTDDSITLQFQSNYGPVHATLLGCGVEYDLGNLTAVRASVDRPGFSIYECDFSLSGYDEGIYQLKIEVGSPVSLTLVSPYLNIKNSHPDTVLLEYTNYRFKDDIIFETGFSPSKRVKGAIRYKTPARKDTLFEDQPLNQSLIKSRHYRVFQFTVGDALGVPDYEIDCIDRILGCSDVQIDGRYFTIGEDKWSESSESDYPMKAWKIDLREALNRTSKTYDDDTINMAEAAIIINTDSKGFTSGGTQIYSIEDIN